MTSVMCSIYTKRDALLKILNKQLFLDLNWLKTSIRIIVYDIFLKDVLEIPEEYFYVFDSN